jgi:hypothetical protein
MKRIVLAAACLAGCNNAGSDLSFAPTTHRTIAAVLYTDRDGSGSRTSADAPVAGARIALRPPGGGQVIVSSLTNEAGVASLFPIPVGHYTVTVDPGTLGDSLSVRSVDPNPVELPWSPDTGAVVVNILLAYPSLSIRQARLEPPGRRVILRGLVLSGPQAFRDTTAHLQDTSGYLRLTRVSVRGGGGAFPGDTITVLGTTGARAGQPVLDLATISIITNRPAPVAIATSTAAAASASGGTLDAALVQVTGAIISDTATVAPDFRVTVNDGSGPLTVLLDAQTGFNPEIFRPGRSSTIRGVLVPNGTGQWRLKPRFGADVQLF